MSMMPDSLTHSERRNTTPRMHMATADAEHAQLPGPGSAPAPTPWWRTRRWQRYLRDLLLVRGRRRYTLSLSEQHPLGATDTRRRLVLINPTQLDVPADAADWRRIRHLPPITITTPASTSASVAASRRDLFQQAVAVGLVEHEAGHIRHSGTRPPESTLGWLWNALEDERQERLQALVHPELRDLFTFLGDVVWSGTEPTDRLLDGCLLWRWEHDRPVHERTFRPSTPEDTELWQCSVRPLVEQAWAAFLQVLERELGTPPPYPEALLPQAAQSRACTDGMMAVTDALYFCTQARAGRAAGVGGGGQGGTGGTLGTLSAVLETCDPRPLPSQPGAVERWIYGQGTQTPTGASAAPALHRPVTQGATGTTALDTGPVATLRRLIRRGGTALLVGATGVGKSVCARHAAVSEGAALVLVEGWPGLEDRDLFGKVYPVEGPDGRSFAWVDGPLAEAWRLAAAGARVVLVLDELARFDPYHLAPLMGALDRVRGAELQHLAGLRDEVCSSLQPDEDYRVLKLPNGERLIAPAAQLSVLATTNLGADYIQTQQEFDAALLRRFDLHLDVQRLEASARRAILVGHGLPPRVADVLVAIEDYSVAETGAHNGLLRRELNLGTCVTWATEARELVREGGQDMRIGWGEAVIAAAELTAIPFACPRDTDGYLEAPSAQSLHEQIRRVVNAARL